ncbi:hypothetical protein FPOAC1_005392 [Fusarium poae]|uniref:hypothetical protein n=1 Tax=Fusarium poae TaxID=36050 RepID=UPI001CEB995B|nr:hypothetical protein FPOAC1_005392 [Fusarium poae]KAG8672131.1 hypothetical protein FPOAC1_005392 [Fusarium poae]
MAPSLDHVFTMRLYTSPEKALVVPEAKGNNHRIIAFLTHGHVKGSGFEAELQPGGADWILRDPETNTGHIDVRVQFRTKEGQGLYIHFQGVLQIDNKWMEVFTRGPEARTLEFGENYWLSAPILETSHPDFKWVERSEFVGELRWLIDEDGSVAVENAIYKIQSADNMPEDERPCDSLTKTRKPECNNCINLGRVCSYGPLKLPLRERRAQQKEVHPWEQAPWQIEQPSQQLSVKRTPIPTQLPFMNHDREYNKLACEMPLKSHELFQYLFKYEQGPKNSPKTPVTNCLMRLTDDPCALRSTILLAGMHFCFQNGNLAFFESTFLYHKVEVMRYINKWIASSSHKRDTTIIRQMTTLAFTEVCTGEILGAEAHASGILAIIENAAARDKKEKPDISNYRQPDQELANRYFIMAYTYISGLKSLLGGVCRLGGVDDASIEDFSAKELVEMSYLWHKGEALQSWALKLQALRLLPFFLAPLPVGATFNYADGHAIIQSLRQFTCPTGVDDSENTSICTNSSDKIFENFWRRGPASRLLGECVLAHVETISVNKGVSQSFVRDGTSFESPWCALVIAAMLYGQVILGALEPIDNRMHKYTITLFHHDMASYIQEGRGSNNPGLLLWLLLLGLVGCHIYPKDEKDKTPHPSVLFFQAAVRRQAKEVGISTWSEARVVLAEVVWPSASDRSAFIKDLWDGAVLLDTVI